MAARVLADPHREPVGPLPRARRPARARRRRVALPPEPAQARRRRDGVRQAAGGALPRARRRSSRPPAAEPVPVGAQVAAAVRRGASGGRAAAADRGRALAAHPGAAAAGRRAAHAGPARPLPRRRRPQGPPGGRRRRSPRPCPEGAGAALVAALADEHGTVRRAAAAGLRELVEVLPATPALRRRAVTRNGLTERRRPVVRATGLDVLRALRLGDRRTSARRDRPTRPPGADRGGPRAGLARRVRPGGARPPATRPGRCGSGRPRGWASSACRPPSAGAARRRRRPARPGRRPGGVAGPVGAPLDGRRRCAGCGDPAWQVRVGAARCLAAADPETAVEPLVAALADPTSTYARPPCSRSPAGRRRPRWPPRCAPPWRTRRRRPRLRPQSARRSDGEHRGSGLFVIAPSQHTGGVPDFDVLVIGSGPGGQKAAIAAAKLGRRVAIVEHAT